VTDIDIFQPVLEVGPNEKGEGSAMTLLWDGEDRAILVAAFDGQEITSDLSPELLLRDVRGLVKQAGEGQLQIVQLDHDLLAKLEEKVSG
jgi:hypothetical protein